MRLAAALLIVTGCSRDTRPEGLPPAAEWHSDDPAAAIAASPNAPRGAAPPSSDPHAGIVGAPPLGGGGGGAAESDPHAGVVGAPPLGNTEPAPHAAGGGVDVTQLGLSSPDPSRPIDPNRHIKGLLSANAKVKDRVKSGTAIFLMVRKQGTDASPGALVAVDRVVWSGANQTFELTERHAMVQGGPDFVGDLIVMARVDQDGDAMTKQPGDVTGMARVKVPATGVTLDLDTVLP